MARDLNLALRRALNHMLLVLQLGMDRHSLIKGHEARVRECPGSQLLLPVIYLRGLYESVTNSEFLGKPKAVLNMFWGNKIFNHLDTAI